MATQGCSTPARAYLGAPLKVREDSSPEAPAPPPSWEKAEVKALCSVAGSPRDCCAMAVTSAALSPSSVPSAPSRWPPKRVCRVCRPLHSYWALTRGTLGGGRGPSSEYRAAILHPGTTGVQGTDWPAAKPHTHLEGSGSGSLGCSGLSVRGLAGTEAFKAEALGQVLACSSGSQRCTCPWRRAQRLAARACSGAWVLNLHSPASVGGSAATRGPASGGGGRVWQSRASQACCRRRRSGDG